MMKKKKSLQQRLRESELREQASARRQWRVVDRLELELRSLELQIRKIELEIKKAKAEERFTQSINAMKKGA